MLVTCLGAVLIFGVTSAGAALAQSGATIYRPKLAQHFQLLPAQQGQIDKCIAGDPADPQAQAYCGCVVKNQERCSSNQSDCMAQVQKSCRDVASWLLKEKTTSSFAILPQTLGPKGVVGNSATKAQVPVLRDNGAGNSHPAPFAGRTIPLNPNLKPVHLTLPPPGSSSVGPLNYPRWASMLNNRYRFLRFPTPSLSTSMTSNTNRPMVLAGKPPRSNIDLAKLMSTLDHSQPGTLDTTLYTWLGPPTGNPPYPDKSNSYYQAVGSCQEYAYQKNFEYLYFRDKARANDWTPREIFSIATMKTAPGLNRTLSTFGPARPNWTAHNPATSSKAEVQLKGTRQIRWNIFMASALWMPTHYVDPLSDAYLPMNRVKLGDYSALAGLPSPASSKQDIFDKHQLLKETYEKLPPRPGYAGDNQQPVPSGVTDVEFNDIEARLRIHAAKLIQYGKILPRLYSIAPYVSSGSSPPLPSNWDSANLPLGFGYTFANDAGAIFPNGVEVDCRKGHHYEKPQEGKAETITIFDCPLFPARLTKGPIPPGVWQDFWSRQYSEDSSKIAPDPGKGPQFESGAGSYYAGQCWKSSLMQDLVDCFNGILLWDHAAALIEKDIKAGIEYEKSLGAHGCMHPDADKNKCNWSYSMFANWVTTDGDKIVERDLLTCAKEVPDFSVLSDWKAQNAEMQLASKELFPWCAPPSRPTACVMGCCPINTITECAGAGKDPNDPTIPPSDTCSGNLDIAKDYTTNPSGIYRGYKTTLAEVESYFSRHECAKQDWLNFDQALKGCYLKGVVKPEVANLSSLPFGHSIGEDYADGHDIGTDALGANLSYGISWRIDHDNERLGNFSSAKINKGDDHYCDSHPREWKSGCCEDGPCFKEQHLCALNGSVTTNVDVGCHLFGVEMKLFHAGAAFSFKGTSGTAGYDLQLLGKTYSQNSTSLDSNQPIAFTLPVDSRGTEYNYIFWVGPIPVNVGAGAVLNAAVNLNSSGKGSTCTDISDPRVGFSISNTLEPSISAAVFAEGGVGGDILGIGASAGVRVNVELVKFKLPFNLSFGISQASGVNGVTLAADSRAEVDLMSGQFELYAEVDYLIDSSTWEWDLWSWDGFTIDRSLASWDKSFPLKGLSWHYFQPGGSSAH
jgi:hypothetical protein